jgi:serine/threonine-protein kinase
MEEMFLEEARLASQIHHPNVVGTIDLGEHEGILYLVMEWVDGESLNQVMAKAAVNGGVPLSIGVNLIGQACKGLYAAHNLRDEQGELVGLVHRDISPQNLLVTFSGTAKIVDFGIAKATSKSSGFTEVGEVKGKFAYMAPEQVRALAVDNRTDLFALGILLYQITTGKHPFRGENPAETVQNICSDRGPTPPSAFLPDYPAELEAVVLKALAKAPEQRFATANAMLTALEAAMPGPLEASFDVQVAEYLKGLFGARATERRSALRAAQERVDQQRAESSSSISLGTLRTIAIDQNDPSGIGAAPSLRVGTLISASPSRTTPTPEAPPQRRSKQAIAALTALLAMVSAGLILQLSRGTNGAHQAAAASSMVAVESLAHPAPRSVLSALPVTENSAREALTPDSSSDASDDSNKAKKHSAGERRTPRLVRALGPVTSSTPALAPPPPLSAAPAAPIAATVTSSTQPANTFGRGAFGGRH